MLLHTIQPLELVMYEPASAAYEYRRVHTGYVEGTRSPEGEFCVSRLISTDPRHYLDPRYAPGAILKDGPAQG